MLNCIALTARLVADPVLRHTPSGKATTTFPVACERNYKKPGEERQTDFLDVVCWQHNAEFVCQYFTKGKMIAIRGRLETRFYEDKEGRRRKVYEIIADDLSFAESKGSQRPAGQGAAPDIGGYTEIDDSEDVPF